MGGNKNQLNKSITQFVSSYQIHFSSFGEMFYNVMDDTLTDFYKYLCWYSLTSLLALLYLISRLSDWLWASASRWLTTLHSVWASCQYLITEGQSINTLLKTKMICIIVTLHFAGFKLQAPTLCTFKPEITSTMAKYYTQYFGQIKIKHRLDSIVLL